MEGPSGPGSVGMYSGSSGMIGGNSDDTLLLGVDRFGASAPAKVVAEKFGLMPATVVEKVKAHFHL